MKKKNNSFSHRLTVSCLRFTLIPLLIFLTIYSLLLSGLLRRNLKSEFRGTSQMMITQLDELYSNMSFMSLELLNRSDFFSAIKQLYYNSWDYESINANYNNVVDSLISYSYFQNIYNIIYLDSHGYYCNSDMTAENLRRLRKLDSDEMANLRWLDTVREASGLPVLFAMEPNAMMRIEGETLTLARSISAPTVTIGYLIVQLDVSERAYIFDPLLEQGALFGIYSKDGQLLYSNEGFPDLTPEESQAFLEAGYTSYHGKGGSYAVSASRGSDTGIYTVVLFPGSIFTDNLVQNTLPIILVALLLLSLTVTWILLFSRNFSKPLVALTQQMRETTIDNLTQPQALDLHNASDEVQYLQKAYTKMRGRLNLMIDEKMELLTRQAEQRYRFLQYQINPHFMYNTLNVIGIMGMESGNMQIHQSCQMLARLLRYSLQDYQKGTTFREELDIIHTYLDLMKIRFEHKIFFLVNCDKELHPYRIPRFTLQPFVENIFEHAFDAEHRVVTLVLSAEVDADQWRITISDDGSGISPEATAKIQESIDRFLANETGAASLEDVYGGIGVKNTLIRLHMFFHGEFRYTIENNPAGGCTITLRGALIGGDEK